MYRQLFRQLGHWDDISPLNSELVEKCLTFSNNDDVKSGKSCPFITFHVNMALICISYTLSPVKRS